MVTIFNCGVLGGACGHVVSLAHIESLIGMSAGCYALLGMHLADLVMNWHQCRYRRMKLSLLMLLIGLDVLQLQFGIGTSGGGGIVSQSAHLGGYIAGLLIGIILGRNLKFHRYERKIQVLAVLAFLALTAWCVVWFLQWPPRTV